MTSRFFTQNRQRLARKMSPAPVVIAGYGLMQSSNDTASTFSQEANFWYLTGIEAPDWTLVMEGRRSWLIVPDVDEVHRIFDGILQDKTAKSVSGVDTVITHAQGQVLIDNLAKKYSSVATLGRDPRAKHYDFSLNPAPVALLRKLKKQFTSIEDCRPILAKQRAVKQPEEIAVIRRAVDLTVDAFKQAHRQLTTFHSEYEVEAAFSYYFRSRGAKGHAYDPIVAGGGNACTLHYVHNQDVLKPRELLLLDIGARVDGYAADITRTYAPATPTERQQAVHRAVELAHRSIVAMLKPGLSVVEYQEKVDEIMKSQLKGLGLLKKPEDYRKYFPHAVSHGLGIDVHDALGRPETFEPGMVLTVEPGIYIPEEGIGVRIEDDILITKTGHENLSAALPTSL